MITPLFCLERYPTKNCTYLQLTGILHGGTDPGGDCISLIWTEQTLLPSMILDWNTFRQMLLKLVRLSPGSPVLVVNSKRTDSKRTVGAACRQKHTHNLTSDKKERLTTLRLSNEQYRLNMKSLVRIHSENVTHCCVSRATQLYQGRIKEERAYHATPLSSYVASRVQDRIYYI